MQTGNTWLVGLGMDGSNVRTFRELREIVVNSVYAIKIICVVSSGFICPLTRWNRQDIF